MGTIKLYIRKQNVKKNLKRKKRKQSNKHSFKKLKNKIFRRHKQQKKPLVTLEWRSIGS